MNTSDGIFDLQAANLLHGRQFRGLDGIIRKCQCENMGDGAKYWLHNFGEKKHGSAYKYAMQNQLYECRARKTDELTLLNDSQFRYDEPIWLL